MWLAWLTRHTIIIYTNFVYLWSHFQPMLFYFLFSSKDFRHIIQKQKEKSNSKNIINNSEVVLDLFFYFFSPMLIAIVNSKYFITSIPYLFRKLLSLHSPFLDSRLFENCDFSMFSISLKLFFLMQGPFTHLFGKRNLVDFYITNSRLSSMALQWAKIETKIFLSEAFFIFRYILYKFHIFILVSF